MPSSVPADWQHLAQHAARSATQHSGSLLRLCVQSGSMLPLLPLGSWVVVEPTAAEQLKPGDIIVYGQAEKLFVHRLLAKSAEQMQCKGDNNWHIDPPVSQQQLLGRVTCYQYQNKQYKITDFGVQWLGQISHLEAACLLRLPHSAMRLARLVHVLFYVASLCVVMVERVLK